MTWAVLMLLVFLMTPLNLQAMDQLASLPLDLLQEPPPAPSASDQIFRIPRRRPPFKSRTVEGADKSFVLHCPKSWDAISDRGGWVCSRYSDDGEPGVFAVLPVRHRRVQEIAPGRPVKIDGLLATEVDSASAEVPDFRNLEYFVNPTDGQAYYIVMRARYRHWEYFARDFEGMLQSLDLQ